MDQPKREPVNNQPNVSMTNNYFVDHNGYLGERTSIAYNCVLPGTEIDLKVTFSTSEREEKK